MAVGGYFASPFRLVRVSCLGGRLSHMAEKSINRLARVLYNPIGYKKADNSSKSAIIRIVHDRARYLGTEPLELAIAQVIAPTTGVPFLLS
jgi:hypothetical protein